MCAVSGGRSSAFMAHHIHTSPLYANREKLYIFCNTGLEKQETIDFLYQIKHGWGIPLVLIEGVYSMQKDVGVSSKVVSFDNLSMDGTPYVNCIAQLNKYKKTGVPSTAIPYCSEYLKTRPAHHYAKNHFQTTKYSKAIGYRREDIPKRVTISELNIEKGKRICPLLQDFSPAIGNPELNSFFNRNPFKLGIHSKFGNCQLCFKKGKKLLIESIQDGVSVLDFYRKMESKYDNKFFRDNLSVNQLVALAKTGIQTTLLDDVEDFGCVCTFS